MDELPELPFEKVLSYLSLEDRLKAMAVSRSWRQRFSSLKVKSLCFSNYPIDFIIGKSRLVSCTFDRNFISSPQFTLFFDTFVPTILSDLKHLRLCKIQNSSICHQAFAQVLNSFDQLEELGLFYFSGGFQRIHFNDASDRAPEIDLKLNLPMLRSIHLEEVFGIAKLTLDAPALRQVRLVHCHLSLRLDLVHAESVERLLIDDLEHVSVRNFKNLQSLYTKRCLTDSTLLASLPRLKELKEVNLNNRDNSRELFAHKQRDGRIDLKIYHLGLLLNDLTNHLDFDYMDNEAFAYLAANPSRLADEIPFVLFPYYPSVIERVAPDLANNILKRFTGLNSIVVDRRVENIERFLDLVKNLPTTMTLEFDFWCDQPQELYDGLPEHCAVQMLNITEAPSDHRFLFRLEHLVELVLDYSIDAETIRKVFENLEFISSFGFQYLGSGVLIESDPKKRFDIRLANGKVMKTSDLSAAIHFLDTNSSEYL